MKVTKVVTQAEQLASFIVKTSYDDMSEAVREDLRIRILDSLGCAIGALHQEPIRMIRAQLECLRSGLWGTKSLWGRVLTFND